MDEKFIIVFFFWLEIYDGVYVYISLFEFELKF